MGLYDAYHKNLATTPLLGTWGTRWWDVLGEQKNEIVTFATDAVLNWLITECADDALPYHAAARMLERILTESDADWRARLSRAWEIWALAGTKMIHKEWITWLGLAAAQLKVFRQFEWGPGAINHGAWVEHWKRQWATFWIVIRQPHLWGPVFVGQVVPFLLVVGDGRWTVGSSLTPEEVGLLRRLVWQFKSAHSTPIEFIFENTGWLIAPDAGPVGAMGLVIGGTDSLRILIGERYWTIEEQGVQVLQEKR